MNSESPYMASKVYASKGDLPLWELDSRMLPRFKAASIGARESTTGGLTNTERSAYSTTSSESSDPNTSPAAHTPASLPPEKERPYNGSE